MVIEEHAKIPIVSLTREEREKGRREGVYVRVSEGGDIRSYIHYTAIYDPINQLSQDAQRAACRALLASQMGERR